MTLNAGALNRIIKIYNFTTIKDSFGQDKKTKNLVAEAWAERVMIKNVDKYENDQLINSDTVLWRIYYEDGIDSDMIIEDEEGKEYRITGIKEWGYREALELISQHKSNR